MSHTAAHERYKFKPFRGSSHSWALAELESLPRETRILDIGAGSGAIGGVLKNRGFKELHAVEIDENSRTVIAPNYLTVYSGIEEAAGPYDCVLILDVLEHLVKPEDFLKLVLLKLAAGGRLLISLPNIAHWSIRLSLLAGYFNYTERGLLDKTHLRFFTRASAVKFFSAFPGLRIEKIEASIEPLELLLPEELYDNSVFAFLSGVRMKIASLLPGLMAYQNLFVLRVK